MRKTFTELLGFAAVAPAWLTTSTHQTASTGPQSGRASKGFGERSIEGVWRIAGHRVGGWEAQPSGPVGIPRISQGSKLRKQSAETSKTAKVS
jgi:hypothetical protein